MPIFPEGQPIGIWGLGREGRSAARFLAAQGLETALTLLTDNAAEPRPDWAPRAKFLAGDEARTAIAEGRFAVIVKSPGISPNRPELELARDRGTRVTSGTNLWFEHHRPRNVIAVTGTKGKSTTSAMLFHLIRALGGKVKLLGNGGTPALDETPGEDFTVLEISSYQAADLAHAPALTVLTNLYPEHTPWHGSRENYYRDKLRLASIDPSIPVVANGADAELRTRLGSRQNVTWYNVADGFRVDEGRLLFRDAPMAIEGAPPRGEHNLSNLAAAATAARLLGLIDAPDKIPLGDFAPLPHRLEEFALPGGVLAVDDSISTIPEATRAAVSVYRASPLHLILGGTERGQDYAQLAAFLKAHPPRGVYLLPETGPRIAETLAECGCAFPVQICADMDGAVTAILALARQGDVILLSPAAPSFGQYRDFAERGDHFRSLCERGAGAGKSADG